MRKLNLVIPMAGEGGRFKKAGFRTPKPFLRINGKPMIQYVLDAFPSDVEKHLIVSEGLSDEQRRYLAAQKNVRLIAIAPHVDGPGQSLLAAARHLPLEGQFFIAYSDVFWTWNFDDVRRALDCDGVIFTRTGYHPHTVGKETFCLPTEGSPTQLAEIREGASFTEKPMEEPISVGAFYVRRGQDMMNALAAMKKANLRIDGELFPSLVFSELVASKKRVALHEVDFCVHWDTPERVRDFFHWAQVIKRNPADEQSSREHKFWSMYADVLLRRAGSAGKRAA